MNDFLDSANFPGLTGEEAARLQHGLDAARRAWFQDGILPGLGRMQRILADNNRRDEWDDVFARLLVLFQCGRSVPLDGPMIGVPLAIRDTDYFRQTARFFGRDRSLVADIEWMATAWNCTFADSGLWMGKTFEPLARDAFAARCGNDPAAMAGFDPRSSRIGRNFFRQPPDPHGIQPLGLPVLSRLWRLQDRPLHPGAADFDADLQAAHLVKEQRIPYSMTGGFFLAQPGHSVVPEMNGKPVYQLNYRWPAFDPPYPMTRLVDELVQVASGVYLGQLVMASRHYSLGSIEVPLLGFGERRIDLGEPYRPEEGKDYGYQNNGFFLMIDPDLAREAYSDPVFPHLRPRPGEQGYEELGYGKRGNAAPFSPATRSAAQPLDSRDWLQDWRRDPALLHKFTTFCFEESPCAGDPDLGSLRHPDESVLQAIQRLQGEIGARSRFDDDLRHFEELHRLFRAGIAPKVENGLFHGQGRGFNTRFDAPEERKWYGRLDPCLGFDHYHGATINLHCGLGDTARQRTAALDEEQLLPSGVALALQKGDSPNLLDTVWAAIGRCIFPWAGKSFEKVSPRKLSMLLDESDDLRKRYPERVAELRRHPASWPHYDLVKKNESHHWPAPGAYAAHLSSGSWDSSMNDVDRAFWEGEAGSRWVFGTNLQDRRILPVDPLFRVLDMNYGPPLPSIQRLANGGPSPFVRQGYIFLGASERDSILAMNNGDRGMKKVFQFHYRFPMLGGAAPIGLCLDEIVEIAEGLFLGQLIYSTALTQPFHSSVAPAAYEYRLFGYFLLLDDDWQRHRLAIGFDTLPGL